MMLLVHGGAPGDDNRPLKSIAIAAHVSSVGHLDSGRCVIKSVSGGEHLIDMPIEKAREALRHIEHQKLRDEFAGQALAAMLSHSPDRALLKPGENVAGVLAALAYSMADAMMAARLPGGKNPTL